MSEQSGEFTVKNIIAAKAGIGKVQCFSHLTPDLRLRGCKLGGHGEKTPRLSNYLTVADLSLPCLITSFRGSIDGMNLLLKVMIRVCFKKAEGGQKREMIRTCFINI